MAMRKVRKGRTKFFYYCRDAKKPKPTIYEEYNHNSRDTLDQTAKASGYTGIAINGPAFHISSIFLLYKLQKWL